MIVDVGPLGGTTGVGKNASTIVGLLGELVAVPLHKKLEASTSGRPLSIEDTSPCFRSISPVSKK